MRGGRGAGSRPLVRAKRLGVVICIVAAVTAGGVAQAQPVALVLERTGRSVPALPPYTEILANTTVSLSAGARLLFLHYHTCKTVAVVGGLIAFGPDTFRITSGTKESDQRTPCPRTVRLKAGGEMAGILLRSDLAARLTLSTQPTFTLVGEHAGDFASVRVLREGKQVLAAPLAERRFQWPADAAPLAADAEYELALVPVVGVPTTLRFKTTAPGPEPAAEALVLISVE